MKARFLTVVYLIFFLVTFCNKEKEYTPERVLEETSKAYVNKNAKQFLHFLSHASIERMENYLQVMSNAFASVPEQARDAIAEKMGIKGKDISRLTLSEYVQYWMANESIGMDADNLLFPVALLDTKKIVKTTINGDKALIEFENSGTLTLLREEKVWKIDKFVIPRKSIEENSSDPGTEE